MKRLLLFIIIISLALLKFGCASEGRSEKSSLHIAKVTLKKLSEDCDYPFALMIDGKECLYPVNWNSYSSFFAKDQASFHITYKDAKNVKGDCANGKSIEISYIEPLP
jgi:hypothetical protein